MDQMTLGLKEFRVQGLGFTLNHKPVQLRAGSVVWHRWLRDPESGTLAFDEKWFEKNIVQRLKSHGANALRFHLGMPPGKLLDLCDKYGILVQAEWSFFHGMEGSKESLVEQWRNWLDLCVRHPSIAIIHAWNETDEDQLEVAYEALEILSQEYPPLVFGHRDVIHLHKYWWSCFENVGVYYDSPEDFDKPVMVDEFGGNYLDGEGESGKYPMVIKGFQRFLGYNNTKELRLQLQCDSYSRIAEYWRRIGAAGFSPFCILGSLEDGNHHFMGRLEDANPKPVWGALTAAYSPLSCSLNIWDRNFVPGQKIALQVYLFNDTSTASEMNICVSVASLENSSDIKVRERFTRKIDALTTGIIDLEIQLPGEEGEWQLAAMLENKPDTISHPVVSTWRIRTITVKVPEILWTKIIAVPDCEKELHSFLAEQGLKIYSTDEHDVDVLLTSKISLERIIREPALKKSFEERLSKGCSIVMLDVGPRDFGMNYPLDDSHISSDDAYRKLDYNAVVENELFHGIKAVFRKVGEGESFIHPSINDSSLWENLDQQATWIWNGLRGGLIVPAWDMEVYGQGSEDFITQWVSRGADVLSMKLDDYFAYELNGLYAFSYNKDEKIMDELREKVKFLREDAPALKDSLNPDGPIRIINLSDAYRESINSQFKSFNSLASCGWALL